MKDYMALPPSQYSVLDADAIVRMTDDSFRCQIGGISFFGELGIHHMYVCLWGVSMDRPHTHIGL